MGRKERIDTAMYRYVPESQCRQRGYSSVIIFYSLWNTISARPPQDGNGAYILAPQARYILASFQIIAVQLDSHFLWSLLCVIARKYPPSPGRKIITIVLFVRIDNARWSHLRFPLSRPLRALEISCPLGYCRTIIKAKVEYDNARRFVV